MLCCPYSIFHLWLIALNRTYSIVACRSCLWIQSVQQLLQEVIRFKYWITNNCYRRTSLHGATYLNVVMYKPSLSKHCNFKEPSLIEISWSLQRFVLSQSKPEKKCAMQFFLFVSSVGPSIASHTVWDNVPNGWPGARNTKKPSSLVVWLQAGGAIGLVYIEIKAE